MDLFTGLNLQSAFRSQSVGLRGEIALFQAFIRAFNSLGPGALAKEYHGNRYQVKFEQARGAGRSNPRCELCDVLIIQYPANNPSAARLTFNQAKVTSNPLGCHDIATSTATYRFRANLEQWDLLSNRPLLSAATSAFRPPPNLLSGAILPSVGSYGVFYPVGNAFDFAYFVADGLQPINNSSRRSGTLSLMNPLIQYRNFAGYMEVNGTCCLEMFGRELARGVVGTPIKELLNLPDGSGEIRSWLASLLLSLRQEYSDSQLPQELLQGLELQNLADTDGKSVNSEGKSPIRAVVLVRTPDNERNTASNNRHYQ
jgi:hypothetical protein